MGSLHPVQVIAVTGGKGGVGKTNVSVNLSLALADLGRRVMLMDADLGLANVDVLLGLTAKRTLADVISGECDLKDVLIQGPGGIRIVPAASGTQSMVQLTPMQHAGLIGSACAAAMRRSLVPRSRHAASASLAAASAFLSSSRAPRSSFWRSAASATTSNS